MNDRAAAEEVKVLGAAVRRRREHLSLRQEDVADLAGCSERFVHVLEQGKPTVRLAKVLQVLDVVGLSLQLRLRSDQLLEDGTDSEASDASAHGW